MRSLLAILILAAASPAMAQPAVMEEASPLEELLKLAYDRNPRIQEARVTIDVAKTRESHVGVLPNPQLKATLFLLPIETRVGPQRLAVSASQNFPMPGTLGARERVAAKATEVATARLNAKVQNVLTDVKLLWYEIHYLSRALDIVRKSRTVAQAIVDAGKNAFGKGDIPFYDVNRALAELARLHYDEAALSDLLASQWQTLNALLDRPPPPLPKIPQLPAMELVTPMDTLPDRMVANRPELRISERSIEEMSASVELAQKALWPNFGIGVTWLVHEAEGAAPDRGQDALGLTVGVELPIWRRALHARIDEAQARERRAEFARMTEESSGLQQLASNLYDFVNARRLLTLYDNNLLPQAAAALDSAQAQTGSSLGSVLERQAIVLRHRLARERALADLYKAAARLEQVVGTPLEFTSKTESTPAQAPLVQSPEQGPDSSRDAADTSQKTEKARGERDPGHIARDDARKSARRSIAALGLKDALKRAVSRALLEQAVLRRNPDVRRADQVVQERLQRFPQVAYMDNMVSQYTDISAELVPAQGGMAPGPSRRERATGPGTLALKSAIIATQIEEAKIAAGLTRRKTVTLARLAFASYRYAVAARAEVKALLTLVAQLETVTKRRIAAGQGQVTDLLQLEMLEAELTTQRANLNDLAAQSAARMATLTDLPTDFEFGQPEAPLAIVLPTQDKAKRRARKRHELRLKALEIRRLEETIALVQASSFPDLNSGQSELARPMARDGEGAFPRRPKAGGDIVAGGRQAYLDELLIRRETLTEDKRQLRQEVMNEVAQAHLTLKTALRNRALHGQTLVDKAQQTLELTLSGYQQGTASFADLIAAQKELIRHRLASLEAARRAQEAYARLQDAALWR